MTAKESLVNKIVGELEADLNSEQLRKVNMLLVMYLEPFELVKSSTDIVMINDDEVKISHQKFVS